METNNDAGEGRSAAPCSACGCDHFAIEAAKAAVNTLVRENERLRDARAKAENGECLLELTIGMMEQELDNPDTYDASFLLANQRVRGVGYAGVARNNFRLKQRIPKGWHLNVCDPNMPTNDPRWNIHRPLPDFQTTDFRDFINQTAKMWNIDLGWEWEGELL